MSMTHGMRGRGFTFGQWCRFTLVVFLMLAARALVVGLGALARAVIRFASVRPRRAGGSRM